MTARYPVALAVIALAACGGNGGGDAPATTTARPAAASPALPADFDACTLLGAEEAAAVLGAPVEAPVSEATPTLFTCTYRSDTDPLREVIVTIVEHDSPRDAILTFEQTIRRNDYSEIEGLEYRAFDPATDDELDIVQGRHEILIDVSHPDGDEQSLARTIAPPILARLP